jgi:hypothetical protein
MTSAGSRCGLKVRLLGGCRWPVTNSLRRMITATVAGTSERRQLTRRLGDAELILISPRQPDPVTGRASPIEPPGCGRCSASRNMSEPTTWLTICGERCNISRQQNGSLLDRPRSARRLAHRSSPTCVAQVTAVPRITDQRRRADVNGCDLPLTTGPPFSSNRSVTLSKFVVARRRLRRRIDRCDPFFLSALWMAEVMALSTG